MTPERPRNLLSLKRESKAEGGVEERLHKVLANAGLGSRRSLEERIEAGEIRVNGEVADIGLSIKAGDRVEVDRKALIAVLSEPEEVQLLIYHKPEGEVTTHDDPEGRPTVFERLPRLKGSRWVSVGRLDINTTGLLLVTTDGELANALMHPSSEVEREYLCRIHGNVSDEQIERLRNGVELEDGPAKFDEIAVVNRGETHSWFRVTLSEGRNREVRRMWESQGLQVSRLKRIRYGSVELPRDLRRGHWRALEADEVKTLRRTLGLGDAPRTLTLQPVIGVRRAVKQASEFRPTGQPQPAGWSGASDEAREIRAFDNLREDRAPARPGKRRFAKKGKPGAKGPRPAGAPGARGPGGQRGPGGPGRGPGGPGARGPGGPGARGPGGGQPRGPGGPGGAARPGKRRGPKPGEAWTPNPAELRSWTPGGPGGGGAPGGPGGRRGKPGGKPGGGKPGGGGNRGSRGAMPAFPSDHAYANRDDSRGNRSPAAPGPGRRSRGRQR